MEMAELRRCIGSATFGIEAHEAPLGDFPAQPSQKDGLGRMCKPHWTEYTRALGKARTAAAAADVVAGDQPVKAKKARAKKPEPIRTRPARGRKTESDAIVEAVRSAAGRYVARAAAEAKEARGHELPADLVEVAEASYAEAVDADVAACEAANAKEASTA
jgi:hypothetical protein